MALNEKIVLGIFVLAFLVMSVVPVCGQSDFGSTDISASPNIVNPDDEITVTYSGAPGFDLDWIAIYEVGDPNEWYGDWYYLNGEQSGTLLFTAPEEPGDYEFRLFENDGFTDIAWSNVVSVQVGTTETPPPTDITPSQSAAEATLRWMGMAEDKVGKGNQPNPDGDLDGHFSLTLIPKGEKTVDKITLLSADESGNPVGGQVWDTAPNYYWILGVEQPSGVRLNPTDKDISKRMTTTATFELYAANSGWFKAGQHFKIKVDFNDGTSIEAVTAVTETPQITPTSPLTPTPTPPSEPASPTPSLGAVVFAVNVGGSEYTGTDGITYQADTYYSGGSAYTASDPIANTGDDTIYQSERWGTFSYAIPVDNGEYQITFKFAEIYFNNANARIFDVTVEGVEVINDLDIHAKVGHDVAYDVIVNTRVSDGQLNIKFGPASRNYAKCSAVVVAVAGGATLPPIITPPPSVAPPEFASLIFESRSKSSGSTVQIPLTLKGATDKIGNMDITLGYDSSVLDATEVIKGGLTTTSLFEYNLIDRGTIKISLADKAGFSGDGSIAYVKFNVIGSEGSVSPLKIVSLSANRAKGMAPLSITPQDGVFTVLGFAEGRGDCDGDGEITAADALCALVMAVGKIPEDLVMDVNGDGKVSSGDAREILKKSVKTSGGGEKEPPEENCDSKHLSLCDNKNDCKGAGGYWHNNQCNEEREEFKCQPIEETVAMGDAVMGENIDMEVFFKVKGEVEGKCEIYEKIVKDNTGLGLEGKDMTCKIPMGAITANNPLTNNIKDYCNGSLADAIKDLTKEVKEK